MSSLTGRSGIVTGASGGLGRATALALAARGAHVYAVARRRAELAETAELATGLAGTVVPIVIDLIVESEVEALVSRLADQPGLDFLVNNAATQREKPFLETTTADWNDVQNTNVTAMFWCCRFVAASMLARGRGGSIVNVASVSSFAGDALLSAYTASKHAVLGLTRSMAVDRTLTRSGIRTNAVCPGDIETPMVAAYLAAHDDPLAARAALESAYPLERIAQPAEIANVIAFLICDDSSFVNGSAVVVDGGLSAAVFTSP